MWCSICIGPRCRPTSTAKNAIVVTTDSRYFCKIVRLLHAPCPFSHAFGISGMAGSVSFCTTLSVAYACVYFFSEISRSKTFQLSTEASWCHFVILFVGKMNLTVGKINFTVGKINFNVGKINFNVRKNQF